MEREYLTFVPLDDCTFSFLKKGTGNDIEYSIDGGAWTSLASEVSTPTVNTGSSIRWRGEIERSSSGGQSDSSQNGVGVFSSSGRFRAFGNPRSVTRFDFYGKNLLSWIYSRLFRGSGIVDASLLYLGGASQYCFYEMFRDCTLLISAPSELPSLTTSTRCYSRMFYGCTSLTTAPALPAKTLALACYNEIFYGCSSLTYIKMLAVDTSASSCLYRWVRGVPTGEGAGVFVKNAAKTDLPTNDSGIPNGWTVVDDPSTVTE